MSTMTMLVTHKCNIREILWSIYLTPFEQELNCLLTICWSLDLEFIRCFFQLKKKIYINIKSTHVYIVAFWSSCSIFYVSKFNFEVDSVFSSSALVIMLSQLEKLLNTVINLCYYILGVHQQSMFGLNERLHHASWTSVAISGSCEVIVNA